MFDASVPGEIAQDLPPLMIDESPSIYDENKWAVRRAGSRPEGTPFFYVNAQHDHVPDPLAHLGFSEGMRGRSWNFSTVMRQGYPQGPNSLSQPSSSSHDPAGRDHVISWPAVAEAISTSANGPETQALSVVAAHSLALDTRPVPISDRFEALDDIKGVFPPSG